MGAEVRGGLATLGPEAVALRRAIEDVVVGWAHEVGAHEAIYPALMTVEDLARLDYFDNFPHLGVLASGLTTEAIDEGRARGRETAAVPPDALQPARYALPSSACHNVYLDLEGRVLDEPFRVTTVANCFRREHEYEGLRRLLGFSMREVVCVGDRDACLEHLRWFKARTKGWLEALGLPVEFVASADPFYDADAGRSLMAQLFPVKEEIVYDGSLAIGSLNFHRNFFGERCDICLSGGGHAFSSCIGFGIERCIVALMTHFGENVTQVRERIHALDAI